MPNISIAIANQKGGVGKTTTAIQLAAATARRNIPTLLIDLDPQGNATSGLGLERKPEQSLLPELLSPANPAAKILETTQKNLWLIPSEPALAHLETQLAHEPDRFERLAKTLKQLHQAQVQNAATQNTSAQNAAQQNAAKQQAATQNTSTQNAAAQDQDPAHQNQNAATQNAAAQHQDAAHQNQDAATQNAAQQNTSTQNTSAQNAAAQHQDTATQNAAAQHQDTATQNAAAQHQDAATQHQQATTQNAANQQTETQNQNPATQNAAAQNPAAQNPAAQHQQAAAQHAAQQNTLTFIDCPPALGTLTLNALNAADQLIVPMQCEYFAMEGLGQILSTLEQLQNSETKARVKLGGIVLTMYDRRTKLARDVVKDIREHFPEQTFQTTIPRTIRLSEASSHGKTIFEFARFNKGAHAYNKLAKELLERLAMS